MRKRRIRSSALLIVATALLASQSQAIAAPEPPKPPAAPADKAQPNSTDPAKRDELLGKDWQKSTDIAWTTTGDATGFHVLAARASDGYAWRTITSLAEPGFEADQWIGNACATASGKKLVVTYAPRTFTNKVELFERGGFTATVDLETGAVKKLPVHSTLAYYSPGCGNGESAVITQLATESKGKTRLFQVDAAAATSAKPIEVSGQVTSAIPTKNGIVAADNGRLITVDAKGAARHLAKTSSLPFYLRTDSDGGVVFLDSEGEKSLVRRIDQVAKNAPVSTLATGPLTELGLTASANGKVFITGKTDKIEKLPAVVARADVPKSSTMSVQGQLAVTKVQRAKTQEQSTPEAAQPVRVEAKVATTGKDAAFTVLPEAESEGGLAPSPQLSTASGEMTAAGSPNTPLDAEAKCAIPRNDANLQVYQPTPRQVEWAVDYAVTGGLNIQREANWKNSGMQTAWTPQGLFPSIPLDGGGSVPPQVMLGILAQESNLWQASRFTLPGVSGNPLIGNFYGVNIYDANADNDWDVDWRKADCGYGITQITDGMRKAGQEKPGETALPAHMQRAAAVDFATNIAAGLRILQDKWNQTRRAGMKVNDGDAQWPENWYYAVWAYNSGFYEQNGSNPWGLGWANNLANPNYPRNRTPFLSAGYHDAAHPQDWSYPEKIMGWAAYPIEAVVSPGVVQSGYSYLSWTNNDQRLLVKPGNFLFCVKTQNDCDGDSSFTPDKPDDPNTPEDEGTIGEKVGPCGHRDAQGYYDLRCWWHSSATWKADCSTQCGVSLNKFRDPDVGYQPDGTSYPPNCFPIGLTGALIVDDTDAPATRSCTRQPNSGSFNLQFGSDAQGRYASKIDFHQIGAGFNGHFWFAHAWRDNPDTQKLKVTGTWTLNRPISGWWRVMVHVPDHGAHTQRAKYEINTGPSTQRKERVILQRVQSNKWVSLGAMQFSGTPSVSLSNFGTNHSGGFEDVAWDAIAFQPLSQKPQMIVAMGDSYSSGEGSGGNDAYYRETNIDGAEPEWRNACHRSQHAWSRQGKPAAFNGRTIGEIADNYNDSRLDYQFIACSGARSEQLKPGGLGQYGEVTQLDRGFVNEDTDLVTLSIGGNDAQFTPVLSKCVLMRNCRDLEVSQVGPGPLRESLPKLIKEKVIANVRDTIKAINAKAPRAKIVLMGYPKLVEPALVCAVTFDDAVWLSEIANLLRDQYKLLELRMNSEDNIPVTFADPIAKFNGMGACGDPQRINQLKGKDTDGDDGNWLPVGMESFHPTKEGHALYGEVFTDALRKIGL
ncbi:hypothetical protein UK23_18665 [Lentzea aerocolonigenes]|uniref:Uncharacterized protein n=1 Tax=Lentzea aerocolonigenes TaxID=68170 RepID=A0A0F0H112_LENAE|nr:GDSL-type esterase/lipase family protein [Lentzea aerocolonigenes]KJK47942.1 hypothetical protein UK23_18665 [Lentzea aerocolonigenes]